MTRYVRTLLLTAVVLALGAATASAAPYQDARQPVSKRVADLLARMTLEEKVGQMTQTERASGRRRPAPITDLGARQRSCPAAARPPPRTRRRRGPTWSTASRRRRSTPGSASR